MSITSKQIRVWLAQHDMTQQELANKLGITARTMQGWNQKERYPKWLPMALNWLGYEYDRVNGAECE